MNLPVDADTLIPHERPMRVVDQLLESDGTAGRGETVFPDDSPFVDQEKKVDRLVLLELVAQTYASARGYEDITEGGSVSEGFLVGISKAEFYGDAIANKAVTVDICTDETFDNFFIASAQVYQADQLLLEAVFKIWLNPDSSP